MFEEERLFSFDYGLYSHECSPGKRYCGLVDELREDWEMNCERPKAFPYSFLVTLTKSLFVSIEIVLL